MTRTRRPQMARDAGLMIWWFTFLVYGCPVIFFLMYKLSGMDTRTWFGDGLIYIVAWGGGATAAMTWIRLSIEAEWKAYDEWTGYVASYGWLV